MDYSEYQGICEKYLDFAPAKPFVNIGDAYLETMQEMTQPYEKVSISDNFFTEASGGFPPKQFSILCGATGVGKTTLVANWALKLAQNQIRTFVISVEIGKNNFVRRLMSAASGDKSFTYREAPISKLESFHKNHGDILTGSNISLSCFENRVDRFRIMDDIVYHVNNRGFQVVFIDNINFVMDVTTSSEQIVEMDKTIHDMIILCKQIPVHIVMVMHPKKTQHGRVESEFDVKGSSTAVQEAHNVFLFNRPNPEIIKSDAYIHEGHRELTFAKLRERGEFSGHKIYYENMGGKYKEIHKTWTS